MRGACLRRLGAALTLAVLLAATGHSVAAQGVNQFGFNTTTTDVTLVTTAETAIVASASVPASSQTVHVCIVAYAQLTTGTNTTGVTARIRRGSTRRTSKRSAPRPARPSRISR